MSKPVVTLTNENTIKEAIGLMKEKKVGSIIIVDEDKLVTDILTERDILEFIDQDFKINADLKIGDLPKKEHLISILETESLDDAIKIFSEIPIHHLVVTDYSGKLTGIISTKDLITAQKKLNKTFPYFPSSQMIH